MKTWYNSSLCNNPFEGFDGFFRFCSIWSQITSQIWSNFSAESKEETHNLYKPANSKYCGNGKNEKPQCWPVSTCCVIRALKKKKQKKERLFLDPILQNYFTFNFQMVVVEMRESNVKTGAVIRRIYKWDHLPLLFTHWN